jgi:hypothetical protein
VDVVEVVVVVATLNVAFTASAPLIVSEQVPVPMQAPLQPANVAPGLAAAASMTAVPLLKFVLHVPGQLIPAGLLVTVPLPVPGNVTFKGGLMATSSWMRGIVRVVLGMVIGLPVVVRILRISSTLAEGLCCLSSDQAPATCGAATEVPLRFPYVEVGMDELTLTPGANRLAFGPTSEKLATLSESSTAATLTAPEMHAGYSMPSVKPSFPAATTTAMPALFRRSNAAVIAGFTLSHAPV